MRFEKGHKENTRRRIIDVASRRIRKDGASATGVAGIMTESGLTNGAFYAHFESKDALVREALASALADQTAQLTHAQTEPGGIEAAIRNYLDPSHLERYEDGCPSAALLPEVGRQPVATRQAYEDGLRAYLGQLARMLPGSDPHKREQRAAALFALMAGTLQIARAVADPQLAENILTEGVDAALLLARA
jgi:AcrR family transcriptional regulator